MEWGPRGMSVQAFCSKNNEPYIICVQENGMSNDGLGQSHTADAEAVGAAGTGDGSGGGAA